QFVSALLQLIRAGEPDGTIGAYIGIQRCFSTHAQEVTRTLIYDDAKLSIAFYTQVQVYTGTLVYSHHFGRGVAHSQHAQAGRVAQIYKLNNTIAILYAYFFRRQCKRELCAVVYSKATIYAGRCNRPFYTHITAHQQFAIKQCV